MFKKSILKTTILIVTILTPMQHAQASLQTLQQSARSYQQVLYVLPHPLLFTSDCIASQTRIRLLLTCIEIAAKKSSSAEIFKKYLKIYQQILQAEQPSDEALLANQNKNYDPLVYSDIVKAKFQSVINAIANNQALSSSDLYLKMLIVVINKIFDLFGIEQQDDELSALFEHLESILAPNHVQI
jgi:hypothetical protein